MQKPVSRGARVARIKQPQGPWGEVRMRLPFSENLNRSCWLFDFDGKSDEGIKGNSQVLVVGGAI